MISPLPRRRFLIPLVFLSASLCFAGQANHTSAVAPSQGQTYQEQADLHKDGNSIVHLLRRIRFHLGTMTIGTGYSHYSGPSTLPLYYSYASPFWGYYGYAPFWGSPSWSPVVYPFPPYAASFQRRAGEGRVKLRIHPGTAEVLINNAYAGTVAGLKGGIWLKPGVYDLCVRAPGFTEFRRRIYVLSGKEIEVQARLAAANALQNRNGKP